MKALEKDRARRYETANGFAADVQRYLADEPVEARPPSAGYRLRKFVRRHKGEAAAGAAVAVALVGGVVGTTWQAVRAEREADRGRGEEVDEGRPEGGRAQPRPRRGQPRPELPAADRVQRDEFDPAELFALSELAELSGAPLQDSTVSGDVHGDPVERAEQADDRLKLLCLTEALSNPETAFRTARRAERFIQAAVGSSPARRQQALAILAAKQRDAPRTSGSGWRRAGWRWNSGPTTCRRSGRRWRTSWSATFDAGTTSST